MTFKDLFQPKSSVLLSSVFSWVWKRPVHSVHSPTSTWISYLWSKKSSCHLLVKYTTKLLRWFWGSTDEGAESLKMFCGIHKHSTSTYEYRTQCTCNIFLLHNKGRHYRRTHHLNEVSLKTSWNTCCENFPSRCTWHCHFFFFTE